MRYISDIIAYGHGVKSNLDIDNVLVKLKMTGASIIGNNSFVVIYEQNGDYNAYKFTGSSSKTIKDISGWLIGDHFFLVNTFDGPDRVQIYVRDRSDDIMEQYSVDTLYISTALNDPDVIVNLEVLACLLEGNRLMLIHKSGKTEIIDDERILALKDTSAGVMNVTVDTSLNHGNYMVKFWADGVDIYGEKYKTELFRVELDKDFNFLYIYICSGI